MKKLEILYKELWKVVRKRDIVYLTWLLLNSIIGKDMELTGTENWILLSLKILLESSRNSVPLKGATDLLVMQLHVRVRMT